MNKISGNYYKKHKSRNPLVKILMRRFHNALFELIEKADPQNILDIGCGVGYTLEEINGKFPSLHIEGSDINAGIVDFARKNIKNIIFKVETAYDLKRNDNSFDLVTLLEVLEHLENPDLAIKEAKRVCREYCIFSVPFEPYWRICNLARMRYLTNFGNTPDHINHWSKRSLEKLLLKHFKDVSVKTVFPWNFALCRIENHSM